MSALRDELLTILGRMGRNCVARAKVLDEMTEILNRKHPIVWPKDATGTPPNPPRSQTGD